MAHVQIKMGPDGGTLVINGHDISRDVLAQDFRLALSTDPGVPSVVHFAVRATTLDVDLPNAVIEALRAPEVAQ